jgi:hypothetical protein
MFILVNSSDPEARAKAQKLVNVGFAAKRKTAAARSKTKGSGTFCVN